ncbi:Fc.00g042600.m01.CDS01 [Cosmosporella sp. VM-42]
MSDIKGNSPSGEDDVAETAPPSAIIGGEDESSLAQLGEGDKDDSEETAPRSGGCDVETPSCEEKMADEEKAGGEGEEAEEEEEEEEVDQASRTCVGVRLSDIAELERMVQERLREIEAIRRLLDDHSGNCPCK